MPNSCVMEPGTWHLVPGRPGWHPYIVWNDAPPKLPGVVRWGEHKVHLYLPDMEKRTVMEPI